LHLRWKGRIISPSKILINQNHVLDAKNARKDMAKPLKRWLLGMTFVSLLVFVSAGTWRDPWLWAYVGVWAAGTLYAMLSIDEDLYKERFSPPTSGADRLALGFVRVVALAHLVVGALDAGRWHLGPSLPAAVRVAALAVMAAGFGMFYRAMRENRFFSSVVRVQHDRGHRVIDSGPYRVVRHPGYAGMIAAMPFSGLALGSWPAAVLGLVMSGLMLRRVFFEDAFLRQHLDGYTAYTQRVPHRLIPGVW
jgi:protein-S-isoprenylcysteine O-methyltransferase Ste14